METITGTVLKVNGTGFLLEGHDRWLNLSRFAAAGDVFLPAPGQRVAVTLDRAGYVRKVAPVQAEPAPASPVAATAEAEPAAVPGKDRQIVRMNVLATATAILAAGHRPVQPADVLALAERLEQWVMRS